MLRRLFRKLFPVRANSEQLKMSLAEWLLYHQREVVFQHCRWMGVKTYKNPLDAWILQEVLYEVKPEVVVEIGSAVGGSTMFLAHLLDIIGAGEVISIDIDRSRFEARHARLHVITGDSSSTVVLDQVKTLCNGRRTLVIHDGDHRRDPVLKDLRNYADLVSVGSYLIVEDGIIDLFSAGDGIGSSEAGPLRAVEAFVREDPRFVIDPSRERYVMTYNPSGYLKRTR